MEVTKLIFVSENNNNKFYTIKNNGSSLEIEYGRVGATPQTATYPIGKYHSLLNSKLKKGYKDVTDLYKEEITTETKSNNTIVEFAKSRTAKVISVVKKLQAWATGSIKQNYTVSSKDVTQKQVDKAQEILNDIVKFDLNISNIREFNKLLLEFYSIVPRKMKNVNLHLIQSDDDISAKKNEIISTEQETLDVMIGQVKLDNDIKDTESSEPNTIGEEIDILKASGLDVKEVDDVDIINKIKALMGPDSSKFKEAYEVTNNKTQVKYDAHLKNASNKKEELFWHGSRNQNWWSIISSGLLIRPANAVHSGSLLGDAVYFASKFKKSFGYTSGRNSYWAGGNSDEAVLALYNVHVGNPLHMKTKAFAIRNHKTELYDKGYDSVHCHAGSDMGYSKMLNDEITVYNPDQCTIKYLVIVNG